MSAAAASQAPDEAAPGTAQPQAGSSSSPPAVSGSGSGGAPRNAQASTGEPAPRVSTWTSPAGSVPKSSLGPPGQRTHSSASVALPSPKWGQGLLVDR